MKILIASCINQDIRILSEFLESLHKLKKPDEFNYFFILSNLDEQSKSLINSWGKTKQYKELTMNFEDQYVVDEETHHWNENLVSNIIQMKDKIIQEAKDGGYDYLLFVDSDSFLHPDTLKHLLSRKKDIISEICWTKWGPKDPDLPNTWFFDKYSFPPDGLSKLRQEDLLKVGGFGGLYLINKKALEAGVSFSRIDSISPTWGEDRHFACRAQVLGFDLWCDTTLPFFHIYRLSDLPRLKTWKENGYTAEFRPFQVEDCRWGTESERDKSRFEQIAKEIMVFGSVEAEWSRCWEYPYAYSRANLNKDMKILDVGCGDSPFTRFLADKCKVHGIDQKPVTVPKNIEFKQCNMLNIPYPDNYFDRVFNISVLEHSEGDPLQYIREMLRVLKLNGKLILALDVNRWNTQFRLRMPELQNLLQELGIKMPSRSDDILQSEKHPSGKKVGEGLSVLGLTLRKTKSEKNWKTEHESGTGNNRVFISIPHTGSIRADLCAWITHTIVNNQDFGLNLSYGMPVDSNRNTMVKKFLTLPEAQKYDWLLMVDSDNVPPLGAVERLLSNNKKIVAGVCWSSMGGEKGGQWEKSSLPYPVVMIRDEKGKGWKVAREKMSNSEELIEVDAVGASCLLIHREVLQKIGKSHFRLGYDDEGIVTIVGEDFSFCLKAKSLGYSIYADKRVQCTHFKTVDLMKFNQLLGETARVG